MVAASAADQAPAHIVVLVDSSRMMSPDRSAAKREQLGRAERAIVEGLYRGSGPLGGLPRYVPGHDYLTIADFGIDSSPNASRAFMRLSSASLEQDYLRVVAARRRDLSSEEARRLLRPPFRTSLNVTAWAMPLGMSAASPPPGVVLDRTVIVLLTDAQPNDGSLALERWTLGRWLSKKGRAKLAEADRAFAQSIRLGDRTGDGPPLTEASFGTGQNQIAVVAYEARPLVARAEAGRLSARSPFGHPRVRWIDRDRIGVTLDPEKGLYDINASLGFADLPKAGRAWLPLGDREFEIPAKGVDGGRAARLSLILRRRVEDPVLGLRIVAVPFDQSVWVPESPSSAGAAKRRFAWWCAAFLAAWLGILYVGLFRRRDFALRLPGHVGEQIAPPLSQSVERLYQIRLPLSPGARVLGLRLPAKSFRSLLYPGATLTWRGPFTLDDPPGDGREFPLSQLGDYATFTRHEAEGDLMVTIERRLPLVGTHRMELEIRYAFDRTSSLDAPAPSLPLHVND